MAYSQQDIDALQKAIAQGVRKVKYQDRETEFRSLDEMLQTLNMMQKSVGNASGKIRLINPEFSKGL